MARFWSASVTPRAWRRPANPVTWGADAIYDIVDGQLEFRSYYKIPAPQTEQENCVAHNGSLVPVPGRDIMVQGWYQGGISVFDFTESADPVEIAYFDRGPVDSEDLISGGYWSAYWYNGHIYGAEIARAEWYQQGRLPLHTLKADIDFGFVTAYTTYGVIGVKVWVYRGERHRARPGQKRL